MTLLRTAVTIATPLVSRVGSRRLGLLAVVALCAAFVLAFGMVAEEVMEGDTHKLDRAVLLAFRTPGNPADLLGPAWFEEMVRDVTALGSYAFIIVLVVAALGYLLLVRSFAMSALVLAAVLGGIVISNVLKHGFDRPRPDLGACGAGIQPELPERPRDPVGRHFPYSRGASHESKSELAGESLLSGRRHFFDHPRRDQPRLPWGSLSKRRARRLVRGHCMGAALLGRDLLSSGARQG